MFVEGKPVPGLTRAPASTAMSRWQGRCRGTNLGQCILFIFAAELTRTFTEHAQNSSSTFPLLAFCTSHHAPECSMALLEVVASGDVGMDVSGATDAGTHVCVVPWQCQGCACAGLRTTLSMADINEGFVKNTESTFGKPDASREAVRNARRVVVKVRLLRHVRP